MIIDLDDTWRIRRADSLNLVIEELVPGGLHPETKQQGPDKWLVRGYYSSLEAALRQVPNHLAMSDAVTSLGAYRTRWDGLCKAFLR